MSMYRKLLSFSLLTISTAFANNPNANLGPIMADAATNQMIKMFPLFMLALGIAVFFSLVQKNSKKAAIGCGGFFAIAFVLGFIIWISEIIANHAAVFILFAIAIALACLIAYMIYSPQNNQKK